MNEGERKTSSARELIAAIVFSMLSILLFPLTLIGYVIWVGKIVLDFRGAGISRTAQGPLSARWLMHHLGTRPDEASNQLLMVLPDVPSLGVLLSAGPTRLSHRLTGYVPRAFRYPFEGDIPKQYEASARVTFFDAVVQPLSTSVALFPLFCLESTATHHVPSHASHALPASSAIHHLPLLLTLPYLLFQWRARRIDTHRAVPSKQRRQAVDPNPGERRGAAIRPPWPR